MPIPTKDLVTSDVDLDAAFKSLEASIDARLDADEREITTLRERLRLITRAALERIDGDSQPHDTHWSEIVGIAEGDLNWLQHAKANYDVDHARLARLCRSLFESIAEVVESQTPEFIAHMMADQIEEAILPAMVLAEDGRTFRRSSLSIGGERFERDADTCRRALQAARGAASEPSHEELAAEAEGMVRREA